MQRLFNAKQTAEVNVLLVMSIFLTVTTLVFGTLSIVYINQYGTVKQTVDAQKAAAAAAAKAAQTKVDNAAFAETLKQPYRAYTAPSVFGTLTVNFPKNWNLDATEDETNSTQLNLYWNPDVVESGNSFTGQYALRLTLVSALYTTTIQSLQANLKSGVTVAAPITVKGAHGTDINGTRFSGQLSTKTNGIMVVLPIRDKTLSIWTESNSYTNDFNSIINQLVVAP